MSKRRISSIGNWPEAWGDEPSQATVDALRALTQHAKPDDVRRAFPATYATSSLGPDRTCPTCGQVIRK